MSSPTNYFGQTFTKNFEAGKSYLGTSDTSEPKSFKCVHIGGNLAAFEIQSKPTIAKNGEWETRNTLPK